MRQSQFASGRYFNFVKEMQERPPENLKWLKILPNLFGIAKSQNFLKSF